MSRVQRETLQHLEQEHKQLQSRGRELDERVRKCEQDLTRHARIESDLRLRVQRAEDLVERRQDALESDAVQDGRLDALLAGLKEAEEEKAVMEGSYRDAISSKESLNKAANSLNAEMKKLDGEIKDIAARIKTAELKASKLAQNRYMALQTKNKAGQDIQDARDDKQREEARRQAQAERVAHFISQATLIAARVPVDRGETAASLDQKLAKLSEDLKRFERESVFALSWLRGDEDTERFVGLARRGRLSPRMRPKPRRLIRQQKRRSRTLDLWRRLGSQFVAVTGVSANHLPTVAQAYFVGPSGAMDEISTIHLCSCEGSVHLLAERKKFPRRSQD